MPLGLLPGGTYQVGEVELAAGDLLALYTDGITEAVNASEEEYGAGGLEACLHRHHELPLDELAMVIEDDLQRFAGGVPFADDRTLVMLRRTP